MEWLSSFSGMAGIPILVTIVILIIILIIGVKQGIIAFNGKGLKVGDSISNNTRIRQLQWDYLQAETEIALRNLPPEYLEEPKKWRTHYVVAKYRDVLELALINNNIIEDQEYIESKQVLCYSAILKATIDPFFRSEDFRTMIYELTAKIIKQFYKIKCKYD